MPTAKPLSRLQSTLAIAGTVAFAALAIAGVVGVCAHGWMP